VGKPATYNKLGRFENLPLQYIYEDRVVIAFNFKDGTKTVSLIELDAAIESYIAGKADNTNTNWCSHLGDNPPP